MRITKTILCDLTGYALRTVDVAVGDNMTRAVCCRLQENGVPWIVPAGAEVSVAYLLPDGTPGRYAQMPDGRPAAVIDGSSVTVLLSDRISAQTGIVMVSLVLTDSSGAQLATFPFRVVVSGIRPLRNPAFYPALGAEFAGKLLYGGPGGAVTPLEVGEGLELDGGKLAATGGGGSCDCGDPYIASDEPPEDTDALWINTSEPKEAVALGVTAVETVEGVELYATDELGTTKGLVRHGKDGAPGEKGDPGEPGRTPVKGEDYFTPSEIEDVARQAAEMVEVPEGGGGGEFSYFIATIDEDATYFTVTEDAEGTPLKFTEAYISVTAARSAEATTNGAMGVGLTEWLNSFNSKAIFYNMSLMADVYRYMLHVKTDGGMLTARMMGDIRCAANIGAAKPMLTAVSGAQMGYSAMQHTTAQSARFTPASLAIAYGNIYNGETAESPMVIDGAMHTVTIGVDAANAVKIGAGSFVEVWYR